MEEQNRRNAPDTPESSEELVITFELVSDENEGDPALVLALGKDTVAALQQAHYILRRDYTGSKGGFLVQFVAPAAQFVWEYHEEIIADLSGLITIFEGVIPILQKLLHMHEQRVGQEESATGPIKIALEIAGTPVRIEAPDITQAEAALKLAQKFHSTHPGIQVTIKSDVKIRGQVPARTRRPRRR